MGGSLLLVALAVGAPALKDKDPTGLVGEWVVESCVQAGNPVRYPDEATITLGPDGRFAFAVRGFPTNVARYVADPTANPPRFDLRRDDLPPGWPLGDREWVGIYKRDGDRLTICYRRWQDLRPADFRAEKGSGQNLMVLRRANAAGGTPK
jgi:uncharacterized protein (TIGR03067 family)